MNKYNPNIHHRRSIRLKGYDYAQAGMYFITICCQDRICRFGKIKNGKMVLNEYGQIAYNEWLKLPDRFFNFELDEFQIMPNHMHGVILLNNTVGAGFTPAPNNSPAPNSPKNFNTQNNFPAPYNFNTPNNFPAPNNFNTPNNLNAHNNLNAQNNFNTQNNFNSQNNLNSPNDGQSNDDIRATARVAPTVAKIVGAYKSLVANGCLEIWKYKWVGVTPVPTMGKLWQRNYYEHIIRNHQSNQTISEYIMNNPVKWANDKFYMKNVIL